MPRGLERKGSQSGRALPRRPRWELVAACAALLAACDGGGSGESPDGAVQDAEPPSDGGRDASAMDAGPTDGGLDADASFDATAGDAEADGGSAGHDGGGDGGGADATVADAGTGGCHVLPGHLPDWAGEIDPALVTSTPYGFAATGLADVVAAAETADAAGTTLGSPIAISGAIVHNTGYQPSSLVGDEQVDFWIADQADTIHVHLLLDDAVEVQPGDEISMEVTEVADYYGDLQITAYATGTFAVMSTGNDVYVRESTGATLSAEDRSWTHHVYGELTSAPAACGASACFDYTHGGPSGTVTTLRIDNETLSIPLAEGDCVEVYAPLGEFDGSPQLDIVNYSWQRWYGTSG